MSAQKGRTREQEGEEEQEKPRQEEREVHRPKGNVPTALVETRHDGQTVERHGRGYSRAELSQAGLAVGLARRWGVRVDDRRRTVLEGNVAALREFAPEPIKAPEVTTGEVEKVERFVEKEVHEVEEEAERVEKKVVKEVEAPVKKVRKKAPPKKAAKKAVKKAPAKKKKKKAS